MTRGTPTISALTRSLDMLEAIVLNKRLKSVAQIARELDMPVATAHRQVKTLIAGDFLMRLPDGKLGPGTRLLRISRQVDETELIVIAAAPVLQEVAIRLGCIVQLGTLENEMVTYRIKCGQGATSFFTQIGMQLEAYCSGIGKVLLAHRPENELRAYLASGPFPALTPSTITDPERLRQELLRVREQGFALDRQEVAEGLHCVAVPVTIGDGPAVTAISASRQARELPDEVVTATLNELQAAAERIAAMVS